VSDSCAVCAAAHAPHGVTMVERSGGGFLRLCDRCVGWLARRQHDTPGDECAVCGVDADPWRGQLVTSHPDVALAATFCDDCRRAAYDTDRRPRSRRATEVGEA